MADSLVAGCVSGGTSRLFLSPLDVLKVRLQLQLEPVAWASQSSKYKGLWHAASTILKEEGVRAFWKGLVPGELLYVVYGATQFSAYEVVKRRLQDSLKYPNDTPQIWAVNFVSGWSAGAVATMAAQPFDTLRTRLIGQGEPKVYPTFKQAVLQMYSENGVRTFYKGLPPALLATASQAGLQFCFYHGLISAWDTLVSRQSQLQSLVCGSLAGITSKTLLLPLDLLKKRFEVQGFEEARRHFGRTRKYQSLRHCFLSVWREEGMLAFYKGSSASILKAAVSVSLSFTFYERTLKFLRTSQLLHTI